MNNFASLLIILTSLMGPPSAKAHFPSGKGTFPSFSGGPLTCVEKVSQKPFAILFENQPSLGLAIMETPGLGNQTTLNFSEQLDTHSGGCHIFTEVTKTFFHPYYDIKLTGSFYGGETGTRCAGPGSPLILTGIYSAEMQEPVDLKCRYNEL